jgi:hypothetical protein
MVVVSSLPFRSGATGMFPFSLRISSRRDSSLVHSGNRTRHRTGGGCTKRRPPQSVPLRSDGFLCLAIEHRRAAENCVVLVHAHKPNRFHAFLYKTPHTHKASSFMHHDTVRPRPSSPVKFEPWQPPRDWHTDEAGARRELLHKRATETPFHWCGGNESERRAKRSHAEMFGPVTHASWCRLVTRRAEPSRNAAHEITTRAIA